ncbi:MULTISPECIES: double-strand break repair helicase AddA [unclassified Roseitalea]|uniref:double-strand break repair helicase AddA n=1 Tax=unclassified Roseitalea TaxID=2639107 RepID=UPI00273DD84E|nr:MULTISPECIES: double-strand break repair helicase AddA [unclassified Roseitalea]
MAEPRTDKPVPDARTRADQARAADPANSAWVSANAGSGKTYVLATRVIRILLSGADPSRILCLTYTRAAAAEMKGRVFSRLGAWVTMSDAELRAELAAIDDRPADAERLRLARTLFARALETPGGLKIQTIHAFCEALLHRFPLEANIAGHFELIDAQAQALLVAQARRGLLTGEAARAAGTGEAVIRLLAVTGEDGMDKLLDEIVARRLTITRLLRRFGTGGDRRAIYREAFGFGAHDTQADIAASCWPLPGLTPDILERLSGDLPEAGAKAARELAETAIAAGAIADPMERLSALEPCFLTKAGAPRGTKPLFSAATRNALADFEIRYRAAFDHFAAIRDRVLLLREVEATLDVFAIADGLIARYEALKRARGLLDFDDLIDRTAQMLLRREAALWVRYKLDQGIDHILVDEAQDTSPDQWDVIRTLADEFFAGHGARQTARSVFAVGDEKQSIYSFQGADPDKFADTRNHFAETTKAAERPFAPVELQVSFRSTQAVLDAVDRVFDDPARRAGLSRDDRPVRHRALRRGAPGRVEVWERVDKQKAEGSGDWAEPVAAAAEPSAILAQRIAETIAGWLRAGTVIEATGRPIVPGDIVVLVRSRDGFAGALSRALKDRSVDVAGADRLTMTDHIAVLDLIALGRVLLNHADDLSLAALLKSPLFGLDEDALFRFAHGRDGATLWSRLEEAAEAGDDIAAAVIGRLRDWSARARRLPVHEFYAHVLSACDGRRRLVGRLGPETADVLDEFVALTLAAEQTGPPALETFLNTLEHHAPEIKREMDPARGEVRIMTVHGAKGLEAPIVFLVDRGSAPFESRKAPALVGVDVPSMGDPADIGLLWRGLPKPCSSVQENAMARMRQAAIEEYRRLLYVGMTRAADHLIVAGYRGLRPTTETTWHDMVSQALIPASDAIDTGHGTLWRFPAGLGELPTATPDASAEPAASWAAPAGFAAPAPAEPPAARPLVPSGASALAIDPDTVDAAIEAPASLLDTLDGAGRATGAAARRGTMVHTLLQMLPDVAAAERENRARAWCRRVDPRAGEAEIEALLAPVMAILDDERFAPLFGPQSLAEVPVMGTLDLGGEARAVSGVIDRLAIHGEEVLLVDYKTGRNPPREAGAVSEGHRRQMALYDALVARLYPGRRVRAALLFTEEPVMVELPRTMLEQALAGLAQGSRSAC